MTRCLLVANPSSGAADSDAIEAIASELRSLGRVELVRPASTDTFEEEVDGAASDGSLVVVAGGDGTMNLAVNALARRADGLVFGLVPMGTGNDLARTLEIPSDPLEAARRIVSGSEIELDYGRAAGAGVERLFVNACIGGFPVAMNRAVDGDLKRRLGPAAFWVGGARAAVELERRLVWLDGLEVEDCLAAGVGNGRCCGGGLRLWPRAAPDDGVLDGCALGAPNHAAAMRLAARIATATHEELSEVATGSGSELRIEADPAMDINVDGELVGLVTPATFEVAGRYRMRL